VNAEDLALLGLLAGMALIALLMFWFLIRKAASVGGLVIKASHRAGRRSRSSITVVPPVVPLSRHSSTVRIRLSASVRTPNPAGPITTPTLGDAGRSSTILHRFVVGS
jgi:hypothetical protein